MAETYDSVARLNELIKGIEHAMLTTTRSDSSLHSCPMASVAAERNGVVWFLSSNKTEKAEAIRTNPRVNLAYSNHAEQRYVSISGFCELVRDHVKAKELWNPQYQSWLAGGFDDPDLILLKVSIQQAEYWDSAQGHMVELVGFGKAAVG